MNKIIFRRSILLRMLGAFVALSTLWTAICVSTDDFDRHGYISVLGCLLLFSGSIVFGLGLPWIRILPLSLLFIGVFLVSTFVIAGPFMETSGFGGAMPFLNALFLSVVMVGLMNKMKRIHFKTLTYILTFSSLLLAYFLLNRLDHLDKQDLIGVDTIATMFNLFQFLMIVPLGLGVSLEQRPQTTTVQVASERPAR